VDDTGRTAPHEVEGRHQVVSALLLRDGAKPLGRHSSYRATQEFDMWVWTTSQWTGSPENRAPHEHDEIGWFTAEDVLSVRLADPSYRGWIVETLAPDDALPDHEPERSEDRDDHLP
jgi:hypothetical protein